MRPTKVPPGLQDAGQLLDERFGVGHVLEHVVTDGQVDRRVVERPAAVGADEAELVDDRVGGARVLDVDADDGAALAPEVLPGPTGLIELDGGAAAAARPRPRAWRGRRAPGR